MTISFDRIALVGIDIAEKMLERVTRKKYVALSRTGSYGFALSLRESMSRKKGL